MDRKCLRRREHKEHIRLYRNSFPDCKNQHGIQQTVGTAGDKRTIHNFIGFLIGSFDYKLGLFNQEEAAIRYSNGNGATAFIPALYSSEQISPIFG